MCYTSISITIQLILKKFKEKNRNMNTFQKQERSCFIRIRATKWKQADVSAGNSWVQPQWQDSNLNQSFPQLSTQQLISLQLNPLKYVNLHFTTIFTRLPSNSSTYVYHFLPSSVTNIFTFNSLDDAGWAPFTQRHLPTLPCLPSPNIKTNNC